MLVQLAVLECILAVTMLPSLCINAAMGNLVSPVLNMYCICTQYCIQHGLCTDTAMGKLVSSTAFSTGCVLMLPWESWSPVLH